MPYTMKTWSVVLFVSAVALSTCYAHFSSDCQAKKLRCPCTNGGSVWMIEEQCSVAGSCRPCRKRRKPCDQMVVAPKCKQLQDNKVNSASITYFKLEGNQVASTGKNVNLTCRADYTPQGLIVFLKNGTLLIEDQRRITYFQQTPFNDPGWVRTKVQIKNLTSADDGNYTCVVISATGAKLFKSLILKVHGKEAGISKKRRSIENYRSGCTKDGRIHVMSSRTGPPTVTIDGKSKEKFVDDNIVIKCTVKANPPAHIKWLFNGAAFTETQEKRYERGSCNESLTISSAEIHDKGNFTCSATNDNGTASETVMINVLVKKRYGPVISSFELDGERCAAYVGGSINITCKAIHANYISFLNPSGKHISDNDRFTINHFPVHEHIMDTKLEIKNVSQDNEGTYTCVAINYNGLRSKTTTMFLQIGPCPKDHYCPEGGNQAFRCPPGTCNNGKAPVVHQCSACVGGLPYADQEPRAEIPIKIIILSVVCALLFLILVIMLAVHLYYHKQRSVDLGRVESFSENHQIIVNGKPLR